MTEKQNNQKILDSKIYSNRRITSLSLEDDQLRRGNINSDTDVVIQIFLSSRRKSFIQRTTYISKRSSSSSLGIEPGCI